GLGRLLHVAEEFVARDARQALMLAFLVPVVEAAVGQLHDDEELAIDDVVAFERENVRMADALDAFEGLEFLADANLIVFFAAVEAAVDDFDGLHDAARGARFPDLAETALAEALQKLVAGDGLCWAFHGNHVRPLQVQLRRGTRSRETGEKA